MQFFTLASLLVAGSITAFAGPLEQRANLKANEYQTALVISISGMRELTPSQRPMEFGKLVTRDSYASSPQAISLTRQSRIIRHTAAVAVVNMDSTSHSVYLAGGAFAAYSDFSPNAGGKGCTGDFLGNLPGACSDLDTAFAQRINCVSTT
ncbi:hypothetical protein BDR22DRAFT_826660 [Usnea florida]